MSAFFKLTVGLLIFISIGTELRAADQKLKTITVAADIWCPINCDPESDNLGVGIDLAKAIFEAKGYTIHYLIMPWTRALEEVRAGRIDAVIGANTLDDPNLIFPKESVMSITDDFYMLAEKRVPYKSTDSLKGLRIGIISSYGYYEEAQHFIEENRAFGTGSVQAVGGEDALQQNIRKLRAGRIDAIIEASPVMQYELLAQGLTKEIQRVGSAKGGKVYLAFSPALKTSKTYARMFDLGVAELRARSKLENYYNVYGLKP